VIDSRAARHVDRILELHRLRIAEIEPLHRLGDDDRRLAVGREVHVVRIVDGNRLPGLPVVGSTGVRLPFVVFSALLATQSVRRS
jgi:hypothetical protein